METFGSQLAAARKAKGYTQEQLAEKLNVSRTSISRWESDKMTPDIEIGKLLTQVLDFDFLETAEPAADAQAAPASDTAPQASEAKEPSPTPPKKRRVWLPIVLVVVLLCVVAGVMLFQQNAQPTKLQANVVITPTENPTYAIRSEEDFQGGVGWFYEFRYEETAGVPFTINEAIITVVGDHGKEYNDCYTADQVAMWFEGDNVLTKESPRSAVGGFPVNDVNTVRVTLRGVDANGNELTFSGSTALSKEVKE